MAARRSNRLNPDPTEHSPTEAANAPAPPYTGRSPAPPPYTGRNAETAPVNPAEVPILSGSEHSSPRARSLNVAPHDPAPFSHPRRMPGQLPITEPRPVPAALLPIAPSNQFRRPGTGLTNSQPSPLTPITQRSITFGEFAEMPENPDRSRGPSPSFARQISSYINPSPSNPFNNSNEGVREGTLPPLFAPRIKSENITARLPGDYRGPPVTGRLSVVPEEENQFAQAFQRISSKPKSDSPNRSTRSPSPSPERQSRPSRPPSSYHAFHPVVSPEPAGPSHSRPEESDSGREHSEEPQVIPQAPPQPLGYPLVDATSVLESLIQQVILEIPTCLSTTTFARDGPDGFGSIAGRYYNVLKRAEEGLGRSLPSGVQLVNPAARHFFKAEYEMLDEVLTHVEKYVSASGKSGYRISIERWKPLASRMFEVKNLCKEALVVSGKGVIDVPMWGRTGRMSDIWSINDFEILSVAFRAEIEWFFSTVTQAVTAVVQDNEKQGESKVERVENPRSSSKDKGKQVADGERLEYTHDRTNNTTRSIPAPTTYEPLYPEHYNGIRPAEERSISSRVQEGPAPRSINNPFLSAPQHISHSRLTNPEVFRPLGSITTSANRIGGGESGSQRFREMLKPTYPDETNQQEFNQQDSYRPTSLPSSRVRFETGNGGDPDDSSSDDSDKGKDDRRRGNRGSRKGRKKSSSREPRDRNKEEPKFDNRLKMDMIPTWDGNEDTLGIWITKINSLSIQSKSIWVQLGRLVPTRFTGTAEQWYYSLHPQVRVTMEQNWDNLRGAISQYWMNRAFMDKQKMRANKATYRDQANAKETPSEYFIRKLNLLQLAYDYNDRELIQEIMNGVPTTWTTIVTPHLYLQLEDFQANIKYHEELLMKLDTPRTYFGNFGANSRGYSRNPFMGGYRNSPAPTPARVNLVGASDKLPPPQFPKDDSNVSKRATPLSKGGRACRHCGSMNHWDYECKYSRRGERRARANFVEVAEDEADAQAAYDELYYNLDSEDEGQQDF